YTDAPGVARDHDAQYSRGRARAEPIRRAFGVEPMADTSGDHEPAWISRMEEVDWASLEGAYGKADNVGELIKTIAVGDEPEAHAACEILDQQLVHQASTYSSTYEAIPFLIETLAYTRDRSQVFRLVLRLLDEIVSSSVHWIEMGEAAEPANGQAGWQF